MLVAQEGYALPGQILVNADSHTCSSGAMNCLARGHGAVRDALHPLQGPDLVPGRPDHEGRARGRRCRSGCTPGTSSTTSPASTATSPAATSSGTATASPTSTSTAASRWRRSRPSCRPSSRCSRTTTCSPSTSRAGPSGRSSPSHPDDDAEYDQDDHRRPVGARAPGRAARQGGVEHRRAPARSRATKIKVDQAFIGSCANGRLSDFADRRRDPRRTGRSRPAPG